MAGVAGAAAEQGPPPESGPPADPALLEEAADLVRRAGLLSLRWFHSPDLRIDSKGDGTPVTEADRAVERFLREEIGRRHPNDGIVGEEEAAHRGSSGRQWIIDPIDGTKAFTRGVPLFANLLAIEDPFGPAVGIVNVPAIGEMVWAGRGLGCWCNQGPAAVSHHPVLAGAYVSTSAYDGWDDDTLLRVKGTGAVLRTWGDGYGYLLVATGKIDAMIDPAAERYDLAPMPVILSEAGGRFSDYAGEATATGGNAVATNGRLHDAVLEVLRP
jgi:histidinol-phosphatase